MSETEEPEEDVQEGEAAPEKAPKKDEDAESISADAIDELLAAAGISDLDGEGEKEEEGNIESLLSQLTGTEAATTPVAPGAAAAFELADLEEPAEAARELDPDKIELLRNVTFNVRVELGRSRMMVENILRLGKGSVVELDKLAGDPLDILVNDRLVARGEILVLNDNFCIRITEILTDKERMDQEHE